MSFRKGLLTAALLGTMAIALTVAPTASSAANYTLKTFEFKEMPELGTTAGGQKILLGGFSGLHYEGKSADGKWMFIANTDRGPNGEPAKVGEITVRPFALPDFTPLWVRFELDPASGELKITEQVKLMNTNGKPLTGLPNLKGEKAGMAYADEIPADIMGKTLAYDPMGADLEGIIKVEDGTYYMPDEYRPSVYHFDAKGVLIERFVPKGSNKEATTGTEVFPEVYAQRRANRGFEAIAYQDGKLYAFVQSPIDNPDTAKDDSSKKSVYTRIIEMDIKTKTVTGEYLYMIEGNGSDKIGDAVAVGKGEFLVVERDDLTGEKALKKLFRIKLEGATNLMTLDAKIAGVGGTLELLDAEGLKAAYITPVSKTVELDFIKLGYDKVDKIEGLTMIDEKTFAVINDNDFGVGGIALDVTKGTFETDPAKLRPIVLGIITLE